MSKMHIAGDLHSSPYEPMQGHPILYRPARNTADGRDIRAGFITRVHKDTDRDLVDIVVFAPSGVYHLTRVPYSEDSEDANCWFWPQPLVKRPIQIKECKPEDSKKETIKPDAKSTELIPTP